MNGALGVMLGSFIASWGMSALYFIVGMSSILLFMKAIGKEKYEGRFQIDNDMKSDARNRFSYGF